MNLHHIVKYHMRTEPSLWEISPSFAELLSHLIAKHIQNKRVFEIKFICDRIKRKIMKGFLKSQ